MSKFRVEQTLYNNDGYLDIYKEEYSELFARKGEIFERFKLTDKLREEFNAYGSEWNYIFLNKNKSKWLLAEDNKPNDMEEVL